MREFTIVNWGDGTYRVGWQQEGKPPHDFIDIPDELSEHVSTIIDYVSAIKSPDEVALDKAREYVKTVPDEDKIALIEVFPLWKAGLKVIQGDEVQHLGKLYRCLQGHTTQADWEPQLTPALWLTIVPEGVVADWAQPTGAHDAYNTGDVVLYNGQQYRSLIDANVWSPVDYPAGWEVVA